MEEARKQGKHKSKDMHEKMSSAQGEIEVGFEAFVLLLYA